MKKTILGQSLVEVTFAIGIIALIVTAIVGLSTIAVRNSTAARTKTQASKYAQEASEWLRRQRDGEIWDDGLTGFYRRASLSPGTNYCLDTLDSSALNTTGSCGGTTISGTILERNLTLIADHGNCGANTVRADIVVSWNDSQGYHEVKMSTCLTDWRGDI